MFEYPGIGSADVPMSAPQLVVLATSVKKLVTPPVLLMARTA
jgi:hypothetical protein